MANSVAQVEVLLHLINAFSGVVVKVKKNGEFHKKIYCSELYTRCTREITGRSSWSKIGKFDDFLPSAFVVRSRNDHLLIYYRNQLFNLEPWSPYWDWEIHHVLAMPCEICNQKTGDCEVDGRRLSAMNFLFFKVNRAVECCKLCKKIYDNIDQTNTWNEETLCYC